MFVSGPRPGQTFFQSEQAGVLTLIVNVISTPFVFLFSFIWIRHGTIIRTGITCKKIPWYMRDSASRWFIVKKAKVF